MTLSSKTPKLVSNVDQTTPLIDPIQSLTSEQLSKFKILRTSLTLTDPNELAWCDDRCLLRYLRATKWITKDAIKKLNATLVWRRDFKPTEMDPEDVKKELSTGKVYLNGFDKSGQIILYMVLQKNGSGDWDRGLRFSIYVMEKAFKIMPCWIEKMCILVDYYKMKGGQPLSVTRQWIDIMSSHYPERLGHAFQVNTSWYISAFLKLISPFLDPVTKSKIHLVKVDQKKKDEQDKDENNNENKDESKDENNNENKDNEKKSKKDDVKKNKKDDKSIGFGTVESLKTYIDNDQLDSQYGGEFTFEYEFDEYWNEFNATPALGLF